ncbi:MAG: hypothetical protein Q9208_001263 [Pyrenodesmia sp. 3 TL-2023]
MGKFRMRPDDDDLPKDWWFASTAIPLSAATTGPLANVMSIAALITYWRNNYDPDYPGVDAYSSGFPDPRWCIALNIASRVRYIVALPATIILWYFATGIEISRDNIIKPAAEKRRVKTIDRSVTTTVELEQRQRDQVATRPRLTPFLRSPANVRHTSRRRTSKNGMKLIHRIRSRNQKLLLLQEEKDRFDAMRQIQRSTSNFKKYSALTMSVMAFGLLWCVGAIGFWQTEQKTQNLTYFQALYFCYVSLLTIGYGDLSPSSNAGKPFFIVWSLIAVPTMTILISDMGDTVIASFKRGTFALADWTVLPKAGLWRSLLERHPWFLHWLQNRTKEAEEERCVAQGFSIGALDEDEHAPPPTLDQIAELDKLDQHALARKLGLAIRKTASDLRADPPKTYSYEEWAMYTHLIRFTRMSRAELDNEEEAQGLIEWDWIGENSPLLAEQSEKSPASKTGYG